MLEQVPEIPPKPSLNLHTLSALSHFQHSYLDHLRAEEESKAAELLEQTNSKLTKILVVTSRLTDMIKHFRALENPNLEISGVRHTVQDSVYQVLRAMQYEYPLGKATILKILPHDLGPSPIPREMLEAVIFQLIYNAREALGEVPGIITLEAAERILLSREDRGTGRFVLRVSDTGPGIPEDYLQNLFDPFFATAHTPRLNGVGLCMVKKIVEHYEGLVRVETSLMGTSYFIELPRR